MKTKWTMILAALALYALNPSLQAHSGEDTEPPHAHEIHTRELKNLMDSNGNLIILDARTAQVDDKTRIPHAKSLPYDSSEKDIAAMLPKKDAMIVVYCANEHCPMSKFLVDRLVKMGYTSVYRYPEGLQVWVEKHYEVEKAK